MGRCVVTDPAWKGAARPRSRATQGPVHCPTKPVRSRPAQSAANSLQQLVSSEERTAKSSDLLAVRYSRSASRETENDTSSLLWRSERWIASSIKILFGMTGG